MLTNKQEITFFSFLGVVLILLLTFTYILGSKSVEEDKVLVKTSTPLPIGRVDIEARSAFVYDTISGEVLYAKNENERLPLASLTKVMSALVASEAVPGYRTIVISESSTRTDGDAGLVPGEHWTLKDLLDFSLVSSANDGIRAIALAVGSLDQNNASDESQVNDFVLKMNSLASKIGMKNTYYLNDTGLDESKEQGGAYGSAKDQAILLEYILKKNPTLLSSTKSSTLKIKNIEGLVHTARNTSSIVNDIPGIIASKTGFTDLAGGNLIIAFDPEIGRPIIISLLGSSEEGRFRDMMVLVNASLASVQNSVISTQ